MPIFSDLSLYYSGAPLAAHPHLYATPRYNVYSGPSRPLPARMAAYTPLLPTISESSLSPVFPRRAVPMSRMASPRTLMHVPPRPVRIDTADIDVTTPRRYGRPARDQRQGTIKRDRPLVRLHTKKAGSGKEKTRGEQLVEKFMIKDKPAASAVPAAHVPPLKENEVLDCILADEQTTVDEVAQPGSKSSSEVDARILENPSLDGAVVKDTAKKKRKKKAKSGDLEESSSEAESVAEKTTLKRRNTVKHIRKVSLDVLSESPVVHRRDAQSGVEGVSVGNDSSSYNVSETVPKPALKKINKISFEVSVDNHDDFILNSKTLPFRIIVDDIKVEEKPVSSTKVKPKKYRYKITVEDDSCDLRKSVKQIKRILTLKNSNSGIHDVIPSSRKFNDNVSLANRTAPIIQDQQIKDNLDVVKKRVTDKLVRTKDSLSDSANNIENISSNEKSKSFTVESQKSHNDVKTPVFQDFLGQNNFKSSDNLSSHTGKAQKILPAPTCSKSAEKDKCIQDNKTGFQQTTEVNNIPTLEKVKEELPSVSGTKQDRILLESSSKRHMEKKLRQDASCYEASGRENVNIKESIISRATPEGKQTTVSKKKQFCQVSSSELPREHFQSVSELARACVATVTHTRTEGEGSAENSSSEDSSIDFWALLKSPSVTEIIESGRTVLRYKRTLSNTILEHREESITEHEDEVLETEQNESSIKKSKISNINKTANQKVKKIVKPKSDIASVLLTSPLSNESDSRKYALDIPVNSASQSAENSVSSSKTSGKQATKDISLNVKPLKDLPASIFNYPSSNKPALEKVANKEHNVKSNETNLSVADDAISSINNTAVANKQSKLKKMYEEISNTEAGKTISIKQQEESKPYLEMIKSLSQIAEMGKSISSCPTADDNNLSTDRSESAHTDPISKTSDTAKPLKHQKSEGFGDKSPVTADTSDNKNKGLDVIKDKLSQKCGLMADPTLKPKHFFERKSETKPKIMQPSKEANIKIKSPTEISSICDDKETQPRKDILKHSSDTNDETINNEATSKQGTENKIVTQDVLPTSKSENLEPSTVLTADASVKSSPQQHEEISGSSENGNKIKPVLGNGKVVNSSLELIKKGKVKTDTTNAVNKKYHKEVLVSGVQKSAKPDIPGATKTPVQIKKAEITKKVTEILQETRGKNISSNKLRSEAKCKKPSLETKTNCATGNTVITSDNPVVAKDSSAVAADSSLVAADRSFSAEGNAVVTPDSSVAVADNSLAAANSSVAVADKSLTAANSSVAVADNSLAAADSSVAVADKSLTAANSSVAVADNSLAAADSSVAVADNSLAAADSSVAVADKSLPAANSSVAAADKSLAAANSSVAAADKSLAAANSSVAVADKSLTAANSSVAVADKSLTAADSSVVDNTVAGEDTKEGSCETTAAVADRENRPEEGGSKEEEAGISEDEDEDTLTEDSEEEGEGSVSSEQRCSSSSEDSGFDSRPNSENKHDCDVNCHRKCEKLMPHLCGVNQKLIVEALSSVKRGCSSEGSKESVSSTTPLLNSPDLQLDGCGLEEARGRGRSCSGRVTPPATTIPRFRKYTIDDFHFLKVLGKGSYGKVLLAELKNTECYYAVKCLKKDVVLEDDDVECTLIERKVLALGTKHPYLCHLFATFQTESHLFFVMEYLNGGDLMFHIQQGGRFSEPRARFYAAEIVSGLRFLHNKGIVYRDLKLDNVLLDFDGHIRIADFGMCKLQIFLDRTADTFCGTPDYMAPEVIKGQKYNQCVDWWSFGVLLYEMLVGQSPFSGCDEDDLFWCICNEQPHLPRHLSKESSNMLALLLEKDSSKRLGTPHCEAGDVVDQPFFRPIDWAALESRELEPPFRPRVKHPLDVQYFDKTFTNERAKITPVDKGILQSMDQTQFQGFSYTNPYATE